MPYRYPIRYRTVSSSVGKASIKTTASVHLSLGSHHEPLGKFGGIIQEVVRVEHQPVSNTLGINQMGFTKSTWGACISTPTTTPFQKTRTSPPAKRSQYVSPTSSAKEWRNLLLRSADQHSDLPSKTRCILIRMHASTHLSYLCCLHSPSLQLHLYR